MKLIGRNDPCFCGSGKKYKKCCIEKEGVNIEEEIFSRMEIENMDEMEEEEISTVRGYGIFEGIEKTLGLEKIKNDEDLTLEFKCKKCKKKYEYTTGKITLNAEEYKGEFAKDPVCPKCGAEKSWELTFDSTTIASEIMNREIEKLQEK